MSKGSRGRSHKRRQHAAVRAARPPATQSASVESERLLLEQIAAGALDHSLQAVADAVGARMHLLHTVEQANALAQLCVGDEVRINQTVKPRYLHGVRGRIAGIQGNDVTDCLHRPVGRFASGHVRCSALALDRLGSAPTITVNR
jgi:hypothetical protein